MYIGTTFHTTKRTRLNYEKKINSLTITTVISMKYYRRTVTLRRHLRETSTTVVSEVPE